MNAGSQSVSFVRRTTIEGPKHEKRSRRASTYRSAPIFQTRTSSSIASNQGKTQHYYCEGGSITTTINKREVVLLLILYYRSSIGPTSNDGGGTICTMLAFRQYSVDVISI